MKRCLVLLFCCSVLFSCDQTKRESRSPEETARDQRMAWWREARFGMFIHWGLYAIPAGEWKGEEVPGISEWVMARAAIPVSEYEQLAAQFNPKQFNADAWVKLARDAGMKYIVITAKHHDGFAMFDSDASLYNVTDATPFGRDPLKELAEACRKYQMKLGVYYSQAQDWHEPGGTYFNMEEGKPHWDPALPREPLMKYIEEKAVPQVKEILSKYGDIAVIWWDTPIGMTEEAAKKLKEVTDQYPNLIMNNRLYRPWPGDFSTPEQHIPPASPGDDWEVCMTMNTSWGFKRNDQNWKSSQTLIRMLVDIASKGGNLLLNVGPDATGQIPDSSVFRLQEIGHWMEKNGESIYGTVAGPFFKLPWGRCTQKIKNQETILYLHVFEWPKDQTLRVPGISARIKDVYLVSNPKQKFGFLFEDGDLLIRTPNATFDPVNTVIAVKARGKVKIASNMPVLQAGKVLLTADFADLHNPGYGIQAAVTGKGTAAYLTRWDDSRARLEWLFNTSEKGIFQCFAQVKSAGENRIRIKAGTHKPVELVVPATDGEWSRQLLGEIKLDTTGVTLFDLRPVQENWTGFELGTVELVKK